MSKMDPIVTEHDSKDVVDVKAITREMIHAAHPFVISKFCENRVDFETSHYFEMLCDAEKDLNKGIITSSEYLQAKRLAKFLEHKRVLFLSMPAYFADFYAYYATEKDHKYAVSNALKKVGLDTILYEGTPFAGKLISNFATKRSSAILGVLGNSLSVVGNVLPMTMFVSEMAYTLDPIANEVLNSSSHRRQEAKRETRYLARAFELEAIHDTESAATLVKLLSLPSRLWESVQNIYTSHNGTSPSTLAANQAATHDSMPTNSHASLYGQHLFMPTLGAFESSFILDRLKNSVLMNAVKYPKMDAKESAFDPFNFQHRTSVLQQLQLSFYGDLHRPAGYTMFPLMSVKPNPAVTKLLTGNFSNPLSMELPFNYYQKSLDFDPAGLIPSSGGCNPENYLWQRGGMVGYTFSAGKNFNATVSVDVLSLLRWGISAIQEYRLPESKKAMLNVYRCTQQYLKHQDDLTADKVRNALNHSYKLNATDPNIVHRLGVMRYALEKKDIIGLNGFIRNNESIMRECDKSYRQDLTNECTMNQKPWEKFPYEPAALLLHERDCLHRGDTKKGLKVADQLSKMLKTQHEYWHSDDSKMRKEFLQQNTALFQQHTAVKHDLLFEHAMYSDTNVDINAVIQDQQQRIDRSPANIELQREMAQQCGSLKELARLREPERLKLQALEVKWWKTVCSSAQADEKDFFRCAFLLEKQGNKDEAIKTYATFLAKTTDQNSNMAYTVRIKIRDYHIQKGDSEKLIAEAAQAVCQHPCYREDFYIAGKHLEKTSADEAKKAYQTYLSVSENVKDEKEIPQDHQYKAARYLATQCQKEHPRNALYYLKRCLIAKPGDLQALKEYENIYLDPCRKAHAEGKAISLLELEKYLDPLKALYQEQSGYSQYAKFKCQEITAYFKHQKVCDRLEGVGTLSQLFTSLTLRGMPCGVDRKLLVTFDAGLAIGIRAALPHWRVTKKIDGVVPTNSLNVMQIGAQSAITLFHLLQELEWVDRNSNWVKVANPAIEGGLFFQDVYLLCPKTVKEYASSAWSVFRTSLSGTPIVNVAGANTVIDTATGVASATTKIATSWKEAVSNWRNISGQSFLSAAAGASLLMRGYELGCRATGSALPENQTYYLVRNTLNYAPIVIAAAGKLGVTSMTLAATASAGAGWVSSSVAAGGVQAVIGVATGGVVIIVGGVVAYYICDWMHEKTTRLDLHNALQFNAQQLIQVGKIPEAIVKLDKSLQIKNDLKVVQLRSTLQCQQWLEEGNAFLKEVRQLGKCDASEKLLAKVENKFSEVVKECNKRLTNPQEPLEASNRRTFLALRLAAGAGVKQNDDSSIQIYRNDYEELLNTLNADKTKFLQDKKNTKDEGKKFEDTEKSYRSNMATIYYNASLEAAKNNQYLQAHQKMEESLNLDIQVSRAQQRDLFRCYQWMQEKKYEQVEQLSSCRLDDKHEKLDESLRHSFLSVRLDIATLIGEKADSDRAWTDYCELIKYSVKEDKDQKDSKKSANELCSREIFKYKISQVLLRSAQLKEKRDDQPHIMKELDRCIEVNPQNEKIRDQRRRVEYQYDLKLKKYEVLLEKCEKKLDEKDADLSALRFAGFVHMELQNLAKARLYFEKLIRVEENDVQARLCLSQIARAQQDLHTAELMAKNAEEIATRLYQHEQKEAENLAKKSENLPENSYLQEALQQCNEAQRQRKLVQDEITATWAAASGQATGRVAAEAVVHFVQLGGKLLTSLQRSEVQDNRALPLLDKAGIYARSKPVPQPTLNNLRALRYSLG